MKYDRIHSISNIVSLMAFVGLPVRQDFLLTVTSIFLARPFSESVSEYLLVSPRDESYVLQSLLQNVQRGVINDG